MSRENYWLNLAIEWLTRFRNNFLLRYPGLLKVLGRLFPGVKSKFVALLQGRVRNRAEARLDREVKELIRSSTFWQLLEISRSESGTLLGKELVRLGFEPDRVRGPSDFAFGFYSSTSEAGSIVRVTRSLDEARFLFNERAFDKYLVRFFTDRLLDFATGYSEGIVKIAAYEAQSKGNPDFYLCLDDGAVDDFSLFEAELPIYAFSRRVGEPQFGLVPDPYILKDLLLSRFPKIYEDKESARRDFNSRTATTFWRGATTGAATGNDIYSNKRIAFCIEAKKFPNEIDAKLTALYSNFKSKKMQRKFDALDILADPVNEDEFGKYRHYVDLEGFTSAWGTIRKYLRSIHVFKPDPLYSHYLDFFLQPGSNTPIASLGEIASTPADFEIAYRGYQSALRAVELIKSGEATIFPIIHRQR